MSFSGDLANHLRPMGWWWGGGVPEADRGREGGALELQTLVLINDHHK